MPIRETVNKTNSELKITGRLTFAYGSEFRKRLFSALAPGIMELAVDLSELTYMDSSGLGMFIMMHEECRKREVALSLFRPKGDVKALLQMTRSYDRFTIVD